MGADGMSHAAKVLTEELAYLRSQHDTASTQGANIIANSIAEDIADVVEAIDRLTPNRDCGTKDTPT